MSNPSPGDAPSPVPRGLRLLQTVENGIEAIALFGFVVMMLVTLLQVVARYVLHISLPWTEELARTLFLTTMMVGIALAVRRREHIAVDFLFLRLPVSVQVKVHIVFAVGILLFLAVWLRGALRMADVNQMATYVSLPWLRVATTYQVEVAAIALMIVYVLIDLACRVRAVRKGEAEK